MYSKLLKLNFRLIFPSLIFICFFFFTLIFFGLFMGYTVWSPNLNPTNYSATLGMLEYLEVGIFVMAFCVAMYFSHQQKTLEKICFIPHTSIISCKLSAVMISSTSICLIPIVFILVSAIQERTDILFTLITLGYTLIRWLALLAVSNVIGFFVGYILKSAYSYILAVPFALLTCFLNTTIVNILFGTNPITARIISQLLSISDSSVGVAEMDYPGPRLDLFFVIHALFLMLFAAFLFWLIGLLVSKQLKAQRIVFGSIIFIAMSLSIFSFTKLAPQEYSYTEKLYILSPEKQSFEITAYEGNLSLSEYTNFNGSFTVKPDNSKPEKDLTFRLDACFIVDSLNCDNQNLSYTRDGDYITISAPMEQTTYDIQYHGRVYYLSDIGCVNIFTSWISSALPPNFAFIPIVDGDQSEKNYDIIVTSANKLISNLDIVSDGDCYSVKGVATSFCLFSGFLSEYEKDGITFYRAKYNTVTDYNFIYEDAITYGEYMNPDTFTIKSGAIDTPSKVFLIYDIYGVYGFPVVYDDYIMLNPGLTS